MHDAARFDIRGRMDNESQEVLRELAEWRRRGAALREKLSNEREELVKRLQEVEQALAEIPSAQQLLIPEIGAPVISAKQTTPEIVHALISQHPGGVGAGQIVSEALAIKPSLDPALVHSTIYRLFKSGKVFAIGKRGRRVYRPVGIGAAFVEKPMLSDRLQLIENRPAPMSRHPRKGKVDPESQLGRSIAVLDQAGEPLHAKQIAEIINTRTGKKINLTSLIGALARAAKVGDILCRANAPNRFGLVKWKHKKNTFDYGKVPQSNEAAAMT